jgi:hypothetical protein
MGLVLFATSVQAQDAQASRVNSNPANPATNPTNSTANLTNSSNNPVTPKTQILAQNYFMPSPQGYGGRPADEELLRLYWPFMVFGVQNIFRVYQPIYTKPLFPTGRNAGFGDTTVFDLALRKVGKFSLGGGPLLVIPAGSHSNMSDGKWQAGVAGSVVTGRNWGSWLRLSLIRIPCPGRVAAPADSGGRSATARSLQFPRMRAGSAGLRTYR